MESESNGVGSGIGQGFGFGIGCVFFVFLFIFVSCALLHEGLKGTVSKMEEDKQKEEQFNHELRMKNPEATVKDRLLVGLPSDVKTARAGLKELLAPYEERIRYGEVLELKKLGDYHTGEKMNDIIQRCDAPDKRGFTADIAGMAELWPDRYYLAWDELKLIMIFSQTKVLELIVVGTNTRLLEGKKLPWE